MERSPGTSSIDALAVGDVIAGRYRVEKLLGRGAMGDVYAVFDQHLGEHVALKRMLGSGDDALLRFRREVVVARRISHFNVARTHDIGEHDGKPFLTMELVAGESLEERLSRGPLDRDTALRIATEVAHGLAAAHEAAVVHRDLKPANILLEDNGRVAITDFGVARVLEAAAVKASQVVGTPYYMAPEQLLCEDVGTFTDIYALGLVLYDMLTGGASPFEDDESLTALYGRWRHAPIDPRRWGEVPDELAELVLRCLEVTPSARPTAAEIASQLAAMLPPTDASSATAVAAPLGTHAWHSGASIAVSQPFAPLPIGRRALAVLPFTVRGGPSAHDYMGESLAQELIDVLSRNRGMQVLAFGATRAQQGNDPRDVGKTLGVDSVVEGTVTAAGNRIRVSVRLIDVASGQQFWSDRYDGDLADVLLFQETVSQRIAETLRVELTVAEHRERVDTAAMDAYLRARRDLEARHYTGSMGAVDLLDRSLARAPGFQPALAAHALAAVRAWWLGFMQRDGRDWHQIAETSVQRALARAPELAETHLAAAALALHMGDIHTTARELAETLAIAPTCAEAHRYLGDLQCEAGRIDEGVRRLELALTLDPSLVTAHYGLIRIAAHRGDYDRAHRFLDATEELSGKQNVPVLIMRLRLAAWRGDHAAIQRVTSLAGKSNDPLAPMFSLFGSYLEGAVGPERIAAMADGLFASANIRMASLMGQLAVELFCYRGDLALAMEWLARIGEDMLIDVVWLERCTVLESIRERPGFASVLAKTRRRALEIWQV